MSCIRTFDYLQIINLYNSGLTVKETAQHVGCAVHTVYVILRTQGIPLRRQARRQAHSPLIIEAANEAVHLRYEGKTFSEIGDALGVSRQRAFQLYKLGTAQ